MKKKNQMYKHKGKQKQKNKAFRNTTRKHQEYVLDAPVFSPQ